MSKKPNFFVAGVVKGGTTSLYYYLSQHPEVFVSPIKEPHFFSTDIDVTKFSSTYIHNTFTDLNRYFSKFPLQQLQLAFVGQLNQYELLFSEANKQKAIGEFSTSYLFSQKAAENIYKYNPNAKIIVILRNPIERAFSHYLMAFRDSFTTKSFIEALKDDIKKKEKGWGISELFIELGLYASQIKLFQEWFPSEQLKIILYDDYKKNPLALLDDLCVFLQIESYAFKLEEKYNVAAVPKYKQLMSVITKTGIKKRVGMCLPTSIKKRLNKSLFTLEKLPRITKEEKLFLLEIYRDDIKKTSHLINKDLSEWLIV